MPMWKRPRAVDFQDRYGQRVTLHEYHGGISFMFLNDGSIARIHLGQEQVHRLLPLLNHFVRHGTLPSAKSE
jgi:hypothetical protein